MAETGNVREAFLGIRAARESDLQAILDIYNHAVVNTTATFDITPRSYEQEEAWFSAHVTPYPVIVWEEEARVLGWGSISPYATRPAYRFTGEVSVYIHEDARHRGGGEAILRELIILAAAEGLHTLVGRVAEENTASCHLAEKTGFQHAGVLQQVGYKFDRWLNVVQYQHRLGS